MEVKLWKKTGTYFSKKDNKDKPFTNFYVQCSDQFIPVEVKYFPNPQFDNRDPGYQGRFYVLSAFAELFYDEKKSKYPNESDLEDVEDDEDDSIPF